MSANASAERLIFGLLAQLRLEQQLTLPFDEMIDRFVAVNTALRKLHIAGKGTRLPLVLPINLAGCFRTDSPDYIPEIEQYASVDGTCCRLLLSDQTAMAILHFCFDREERMVMQWLAGVYADPSMACHTIA